MVNQKEANTVAAVAVDRYGGPERLSLIRSTAVPPGEGQVVIEIYAAALNRSDLLAMRGEPFFMRLGNGLTRPRRAVPGSDVAGRVVQLGPGVNRFAVGDAVVVDLSNRGRGGLAERVAVDVEGVLAVPRGISLEAAATLPTAGVTALQALNSVAGLQAGERLLIDGASGGVGGFAVQLAKSIGAEVTAVVGRGKGEHAVALGADQVVDYTQADPTDPKAEKANGSGPESYDVIYAVNGHRSLSAYQRVLSSTGRFVMTGGSGSLMLQTMLAGKRYRFHTMKPREEDLTHLLELLSYGTLRPNIVARYPLPRAGEALTRLEKGHVSGKIIISVKEGEQS